MKKPNVFSILNKVMYVAAWIAVIGSFILFVLGVVLFWHNAYELQNGWEAVKMLAAAISSILLMALAVFYIAMINYDKKVCERNQSLKNEVQHDE